MIFCMELWFENYFKLYKKNVLKKVKTFRNKESRHIDGSPSWYYIYILHIILYAYSD